MKKTLPRFLSIKPIFLSIVFFQIIWLSYGFCQEPKPKKPSENSAVKKPDFSADTLEFTLKDALSIALEKNLNIQIQEFNPKIRKADIEVAKGEFDPNLDTIFSHRYKENQTSTQLAGTNIAENRVIEPSFSWTHKIKTGTSYELKYITDRNSTNSSFVTEDPHYVSELVLTVTQPLLRNRGREIQEADININKNNYKSAVLGFNMETLIIIADVEKLYWDLYNAYDELEVAKLSLDLAKELYEVSEARIEAGVLAPIEIYQSEADVALREEGIITAQKQIEDVEDQLKTAMNLEYWDKTVIPVDRPKVVEIPPILDEEIAQALEERKDLKQARLKLENQEINLKVAKNQLYPDLSIYAAGGVNGLNQNYEDHLEDQFSADYYSYEAGFQLNIPIGNRIAKNNVKKATAQKGQASVEIKQVRQQIIVEVREAVRAIEVALKQIKATTRTEALEKKRLESEQEKFKLGMSTAHDVLDFQESYARALSNKHKAVVEYAKAVAELKLVRKVGRQTRITLQTDTSTRFQGTTGSGQDTQQQDLQQGIDRQLLFNR